MTNSASVMCPPDAKPPSKERGTSIRGVTGIQRLFTFVFDTEHRVVAQESSNASCRGPCAHLLTSGLILGKMGQDKPRAPPLRAARCCAYAFFRAASHKEGPRQLPIYCRNNGEECTLNAVWEP